MLRHTTAHRHARNERIDNGVRQIEVPWARKGKAFTFLFEQTALERGQVDYVTDNQVLALA
jgi:hypothetical protein